MSKLIDAAASAVRYFFGIEEPLYEIEKLAEIIDDFRMVLIVRTDLNMSQGEIAKHCSFATLELYQIIRNRAPNALKRWKEKRHRLRVVGIESEDAMRDLQGKANVSHVPISIRRHRSSGSTQIVQDSRMVMAMIGPANLVNELTETLRPL